MGRLKKDPDACGELNSQETHLKQTTSDLRLRV